MTLELRSSKNNFGSPELHTGTLLEQGTGIWEQISQHITTAQSQRPGPNIIQAASTETETEKYWPGKGEFEREEMVARNLLRHGFRGEQLTEFMKRVMEDKS
jgi:hypothetical protein